MKVMFLCRGAEYLGIEYLSACLKAKGHNVELLFDPGFDDTFFFRAPFLKRWNDWPRLIDRVKSFGPDVLAVSSLTNTYPYVRELIRQIKAAYNCYTILGGVHATAIPEYLIQEGLFDAVCVGEGEEAMVELLDRLGEGEDPVQVNNFYFLREGEIIRNPLNPLIADLDALPFPDKELFYRAGAFSSTVVVLSGRGCPFSCTFCVNDNNRRLYKGLGRYVRQYSPERMIAELDYLLKTLPIQSFNFQDDILTMNVKWLEEFSENYRRSIRLPFQCNVHPHFVNDDIVRLLKEAGCDSVCMGVQSAVSQVRLDVMHRRETNAEIEEAVALFKRYRLPVCLEYIFGLPGETSAHIRENFIFNRKMRPANTSTFILYPFPGTTVFDSLRTTGVLGEETADKIYQGASSYHYDSLLQLPQIKEAEAAKELMPVLSKFPLPIAFWLLRNLSRPSLGWLRTGIKLLCLPLNNFFQYREKLGNYYRMFRCRGGRAAKRDKKLKTFPVDNKSLSLR